MKTSRLAARAFVLLGFGGASGLTAGNTAAAQSPGVTRHPAEPETVFVEGGTFMMGSSEESGGHDETPVHRVTLGGFHIGKYEVTQGQWQALMGTNVGQQRDKAGYSLAVHGVGDDYPMYYVSWEEAQEFARRLNDATGKRYALPTEAQWEFAARGGNMSQGYTYSGGNDIDDVAWYDGNSGDTAHPVGGKSPNELGVYDMSGNVWEWCGDRYGTYPAEAQTDPAGPSAGSYRVNRGGGWHRNALYCRSAVRGSIAPRFRDDRLGFRLVCLP